MFVNGVYSEAEQEMIREYLELGEKLSGWVAEKPANYQDGVAFSKCSRSILQLIARNYDPKNPLYHDRAYAHGSRWGKVLAHPIFAPLCIGAGTGSDLVVPPEIGDTRSSQFGEDFTWFHPIYEGDTIRVYHRPTTLVDETLEGEQEERILLINDVAEFYNQDNILCVRWNHLRHKVYVAPDAPEDSNMRAGFGMLHGGRNNQFIGKVRWTETYRYTPEMIKYIDDFYANEPIRGRDPRWWEDVRIGDILPEAIWGPLTSWDCMGALGTHFEHAEGGMNATREAARKKNGLLFLDPNTNVTHRGVSIHIDPDVCKLLGWYSHSIVDNMIIPFMSRCVNNWMGDDAMFRSLQWRKYANTCMGDTIIARSRVVDKYIDEAGRTMVKLDTCIEDIRGFITNCAPITVELPSRAILNGQTPVCDGGAPLDLNPQGLKVGDHIRVKPRGDTWKFPCEFPLAGETGVINELPLDVDGYVYVIMDNDCSTIDPSAQLGFRMDELERI